MPGVLKLILRSVFFFPSLVALVYVSIIWQALLNSDTGIVNFYLTSLGLPQIPWLSSVTWAIPSVVIVDVWRNLGFGTLIFLAALQGVPPEIIEAAQVDGAGPWKVFTRITIPMISPAIFLNITMTIIGAFQIFESVIVLTNGGPADTSRSVVMYVYEEAFQQYKLGYASAIAVTLFVVIMILTVIQFRLRTSWVHYE